MVKQFEFPQIARGHFFIYTSLYFVTCVSVFFLMKVHTGLIRYSNTQDMFRIFSAVLVTSLLYPAVNNLVIVRLLGISSLDVSGVLLINFFIASSLLIMLRIVIKGVYFYVKRARSNHGSRVLIYGSDAKAVLVKQALEASNHGGYYIAGFIDSNGNKVNSNIEQKKIYHIRDLALLKKKLRVDKLVLINEQIGSKEKKDVLEQCLQLGLQVLTVPPSDQWLSGRLRTSQIQNLRIEDLLQRPPITIDTSGISHELEGKRVLITGAAGSIGSEIVRQVLTYNPAMVILCDQAESPLHEIQLEVQERFPQQAIKTYIGDIYNFSRMFQMFKEFRPEYVFHAAAYKHVPMMEWHPSEAIATNVLGTKNIADLAVMFDACKFVMISTDKAVNPTNIMGASKRIAEIYIQALNNYRGSHFRVVNPLTGIYSNKDMGKNRTCFITTRFGNVLGSNGSVIPRFRLQIQQGKAVTVTHPDITRYFMTIPEAVELVLEAGCVGSGGEIFVFDMGKPVKITDLAKNMIRLSGLIPDVDIPIVFTGLRPGEKLYEEVLSEKEKTLPTHHEKIRIAKVIPHSYDEVLENITELALLNKSGNETRAVRKMKKIVPEFKSKNSKYEALDQAEEAPIEIELPH